MVVGALQGQRPQYALESLALASRETSRCAAFADLFRTLLIGMVGIELVFQKPRHDLQRHPARAIFQRLQIQLQQRLPA
jgi:hypothetical protein